MAKRSEWNKKKETNRFSISAFILMAEYIFSILIFRDQLLIKRFFKSKALHSGGSKYIVGKTIKGLQNNNE